MSRTAVYWAADPVTTGAYVNGRKVSPNAPTYDAAGNITYQSQDDHRSQRSTYDTAGRRIAVSDRWRMGAQASQENETGYEFDGDGRPVIEKGGSRAIISAYPDPMVISKLKYQVWSTVLGASLTIVKTNGDKIETKVFAGCTHIATQNADGGEQMLFHTADPVTGTTGIFGGTSSAGFKEEESEPLGQQIELTDPGSGYPASYGQVIGVAREAEWQCLKPEEAYGTFGGMPIHCQKKAALDPKYQLVVTFGKSDKEESPDKVNDQSDGRPTLKGPTNLTPEELSRVRALAATGKFDNEAEDDGVQSEPWEIPGFQDASVSGFGLGLDGACHRMAELLGAMIEGGINALGGAAAIKTHQQLDELMNAVDGQFTPFYTGWNGTIKTATGDRRPSKGGWEREAPLGGPTGFKDGYIDSIKSQEGQTHHFAAYFSAGINSAWFKAAVHTLTTDTFGEQNNPNDRALGAVAYDFGSRLQNRTHDEERYNPHNPKVNRMVTVSDPVSDRLGRFTSLASNVRTKICN